MIEIGGPLTHNKYDMVDEILIKIKKELISANNKFRLFNSPHEAIGVILEEFEELHDEVKKRPSRTDWTSMEKEAIQVAAMSVKLILSIREGTIINYIKKNNLTF